MARNNGNSGSLKYNTNENNSNNGRDRVTRLSLVTDVLILRLLDFYLVQYPKKTHNSQPESRIEGKLVVKF